MATLEWSDALALQVPRMDATHREFVDLLAAVEAAPDAQLAALWQALIAHTEAHFGQEDRWMQATGFAPDNCHATQHKVVLEIMREGAKKVAAGDASAVRGMTPELASWFSYHAQTMDAALAHHMHSLGFDPETEAPVLPAEGLQAPIHGCGGACASPAAAAEPLAQAAL